VVTEGRIVTARLDAGVQRLLRRHLAALSADARRAGGACHPGHGGRLRSRLFAGRQLFSRLTFEGRAASPYWSADGESVYYAAIDAAAWKTAPMRKRVAVLMQL
jgi:hypothetical protein